MCCVCGGGASGTCVDTAGDHVDSYDDGCEWYNDPARNVDGNGCGKYDDSDFYARDMCCRCGGGDRDTCVDTAGDLVDSNNNGCEWYNIPLYNVDGHGCGEYDIGEFKANEMCCGCGGGDGPGPSLGDILKNSHLLEETLTNWFLGDGKDKLFSGVDDDFIVDAFDATKKNC